MRREDMKTKASMIPCALVTTGMLLSGCTGGGSKAGDAAASQPTSSYSPPQGAIHDLTGAACTSDAHGVWSFKGTISNSSKDTRSYDVTVAVIKPKTSEVLGQKVLTVTLDPGKSQAIRATNIYKGATGTGKCVPVVTLKP